jgi:hypothetical protein
MPFTTIQISTKTKKALEKRKLHDRESYENVLQRMIVEEELPTMEEMFKKADQLKQKKHTTKEIVKMIHELRG